MSGCAPATWGARLQDCNWYTYMCILEVEGGGSLGPSGSVFRMVNLIRLARQIDQSWLPQVACPLGVLNAQGLSTRLEHGRW